MSKYGDQADQGLDKAGRMVDERTGGKYTGQIDTGVQKAKDTLGQKSDQASGAMDDTTANLPRPETGAQGGDGSGQPPQS